MPYKALIISLLLLFATPCLAAQDMLGNMPATPSTPVFRQGLWTLLPDGRRTLIEEVLPDGTLRTDLGITLSPEGIILEGEGKGERVAIIEDQSAISESQASIQPRAPEKAQTSPNSEVQNPNKADERHPGKEQAVTPSIQDKPEIAIIRPKVEEAKPAQPEAVKPDQATQGPLTIVELLPKTAIPENQNMQAEKPKSAKKPAEPEKSMQGVRQEAEKKSKIEQKKPVKPEKKQTEPFKKPAVGQEMRIPPNAAKTGDLSFLEGCWQGTRPEYYTKRTIRECFCFGAAGKNGKRRVFDPAYAGMCIGSAKASLSSSGVLSVTSAGAACTSGDKWGSAQMTCKNSGPKTPCAWIFPDAQGGRQSYTIPFVRVESCGR